MGNPLQTLLDLSQPEKDARGLQYTPLEISQQPDTWQGTYRYCLQRKAEIAAFLRGSGVWSDRLSPIVLLVGAGSSDYVGRGLVRLLRRMWRCEVQAVPSTDLLLELDSYLLSGREQLWISFSRSGDSPEGVAVLNKALQGHPQVRHLVVTCNAGSTMARLCADRPEHGFALVLDDAVNDRGLAMTSSFSNMMIAGQCLAHLQDLPAYEHVVSCLTRVGPRVIADAAVTAFALAAKELPRACFVGSGALAAAASESALKLLELTSGKVQTMSQSTLGLRHGPMSALDHNTLLVQFISNDPCLRAYETDLLEETRRKHLARERLLVSGQRYGGSLLPGEHVLCLDLPPDFPDDCRPPLDVIVGQLLGLFASVRAGLQPDNPSPSGAISRVVSGVRIHR